MIYAHKFQRKYPLYEVYNLYGVLRGDTVLTAIKKVPKNAGMFATTIPGEVAEGSMEAAGFKAIMTFTNPDTGNRITIWFAKKERASQQKASRRHTSSRDSN